jgi:hypothetical protein
VTTLWWRDVIKPGLIAVLETIPGMVRPNAAGSNTAVLGYWPTSITGNEPVITPLYNGHTMTQTGQVFIIEYTPIVRVWVQWQDFSAAEAALDEQADLVSQVITANPRLLGAIAAEPTILGGMGAHIDPGRPVERGFYGVGTTTKATIDIPVRVQIKVATTTLRSLTP